MILKATAPMLCIDPGTSHSGVVVFDGINILDIWSKIENEKLLENFLKIQKQNVNVMAIEGIASYGMAVGASVFKTVEWIGRFRQAFGFAQTTKIYRKDIKLFLCGNSRAKDTNIRQRIIDIFPATGGGAIPQLGIKKNPGPLYGVKSHAISALAVGLTCKYGLGKLKKINPT